MSYISRRMCLTTFFNTIMDVKGKTKNNMEAKMDLALYCDNINMNLVNNKFCVAKPKATFTLDKDA